jgi:hypothetical protein
MPLVGRALIVAVAYGVGYFITYKTQPPQFMGVVPFWLANAPVLVLLLWSRRRDWLVYLPFVLVADFVTGIVLFEWAGTEWIGSLVAVGNYGESALGAALLLRFVGVPWMERTRDVVAFVLAAGVVAPAVNTAAVWALVEGVVGAPPDFALHFFIGDMTGMLVVAPALLAWSQWQRPARSRPPTSVLLEVGGVVLALAAVTLAVFGSPARDQDG